MSKSKEYELAIKIAGEVEKSFYESTKLTKNELKAIAKQAADTAMAAEASYGSFGKAISKGLKDAEPAFSGLERAAQASFNAIKAGAELSAAAISAITTASIAVGSDFEEQMSAVQAISMTSTEDILRLNEMAKELGRSTKFSATEVGQGFEYMSMAGWKTEEMLDGIEGVLNLAAASGENLGTVSDIVTDAMTAFGLGADQAGKFADILAATSRNANTNVSMMGETFKYVAPVAGALGYEVGDTAVAIGLMANSGIKASQAGTTLRSLFSRLSKPTKEVQSAMDALNLSLTDENGNMKSFLELQKDMRAGFAGMSDVQKAEVAAKLAGQEAMSGILAIANSSDTDFEKLTEAINDSAGAAEKMSEIRLDNLKGDLTIARSAAEGFGIELYENLNEPLRDIVQSGTKLIGDMTEEMIAKMPTMMRNMREAGEAVQDFAEPFLAVGGWLADNPGVIVGTISGVGTALIAYKLASGISSLAKALGALNPVGMTIMGLGGVAGVITGVATSVKKASNEAKRANLAVHFGNIALSLSDLQEVAASIVGNENLEQIRESFAAMSELDGISDMISSAANELNRANWKVSIGMELTEQEKQDYQNQVESYIESTREYLEQRQYAINLSANVILGDGAEEAMSVLNEFYAGKMQELSDAEMELQDAITEAFADGILAPEEAEHIAALQKDVAAIKDSVTGDNLEANLDLLEVKYGNRELDADSAMNLIAEVHSLASEAMSGNEQAYSELMSDYRQAYHVGAMTEEEFNEAKRNADIGLLTQNSEILENTTSFTTGTIQQAYGEELEKFIPILKEETRNQLEKALNLAADGINYLPMLDEGILNSIDVDKSTRDAMAELYELHKPDMELLQEAKQQYIAAGEEIPEWIKEGLSDMGAIGALAGDVDAIWEVIAETAESEEYQDAIRVISESVGYLPEQIAGAIADNQYMIDDAVSQSWQDTKRAYYETYGSGTIAAEIFSSTAPARKLASPLVTTGHADGGIFNTPHVAWFAEDGPEAVIPINKSKNAVDLWVETGELLGMDGLTGGSEPLSVAVEEAASAGQGETVIQIDNSRTMQFYGEAPSRDELEDILETEDEKFAQMMQRYLSNGRRVSFS